MTDLLRRSTALTPWQRRHGPVPALLAGLGLAALLYWPGLAGPWLLDDFANLSLFQDYAAGTAPYRDLITSNPSGPLGRPVAMASFAANHALGLFDTRALKATNLLIHLGNGLLVYALLLALFTHRAPTPRLSPAWLAAGLAVAWTLLPLHISSVLYIVQRMTGLAATFSLLTLLAFVHGRAALPTRPGRATALLAASLLVAFPLALFTKESAATTLAALVLIELFFFRERLARPPVLAGLVVLTALGLCAIVLAPPAVIAQGYTGRDFNLAERLLSQPRALWSYAQALFLPRPADLGLFHDDFAISRALTAPAATLAALLGLLLVAGLAIRLAASPRFWPVAFGLAFFLAGHLVESTVIPLELYFEHRNYLPSLGLLLALATALLHLPLRPRLLAALVLLYLALLAGTTASRAAIWGDEGRLLEASARHHPLSLRANDTWMEHLVGQGRFDEALAEGERFAIAQPRYALATYLHMISVFCRAQGEAPPRLIATAAASPAYSVIEVDLLSLNLRNLLASRQQGRCATTDFRALATPLLAWESQLRVRYGESRGQYWRQRLAVAEWLATTGAATGAQSILEDLLRQDVRGSHAEAGVLLAVLKLKAGDRAGAATVLQRLEAPGLDRMPATARALIRQLRQQLPAEHNHD